LANLCAKLELVQSAVDLTPPSYRDNETTQVYIRLGNTKKIQIHTSLGREQAPRCSVERFRAVKAAPVKPRHFIHK
jgi:hypothetical protein